MNDDPILGNGSESEDELNRSGNRTGMNPKTIARRFTSENQPSGNAKSLGWWKKQKGKKMLRALMQLKFEGQQIEDEVGGKYNPIRRQAAEYFGMPEELITVEMIMSMKQIAMSIQKNDSNAFNSVWEKAYGKTRDEIDEEAIVPPAIQFLPAADTAEDNLKIPEDEQDSKDTDIPLDDSNSSNDGGVPEAGQSSIPEDDDD